MKGEYPGSPAARDYIQTEIGKVTGAIPNAMACTCGRQPMIVSVHADIIRVACPCGFQGTNARTQLRAVNNWNHEVVQRIVELAR